MIFSLVYDIILKCCAYFSVSAAGVTVWPRGMDKRDKYKYKYNIDRSGKKKTILKTSGRSVKKISASEQSEKNKTNLKASGQRSSAGESLSNEKKASCHRSGVGALPSTEKEGNNKPQSDSGCHRNQGSEPSNQKSQNNKTESDSSCDRKKKTQLSNQKPEINKTKCDGDYHGNRHPDSNKEAGGNREADGNRELVVSQKPGVGNSEHVPSNHANQQPGGNQEFAGNKELVANQKPGVGNRESVPSYHGNRQPSKPSYRESAPGYGEPAISNGDVLPSYTSDHSYALMPMEMICCVRPSKLGRVSSTESSTSSETHGALSDSDTNARNEHGAEINDRNKQDSLNVLIVRPQKVGRGSSCDSTNSTETLPYMETEGQSSQPLGVQNVTECQGIASETVQSAAGTEMVSDVCPENVQTSLVPIPTDTTELYYYPTATAIEQNVVSGLNSLGTLSFVSDIVAETHEVLTSESQHTKLSHGNMKAFSTNQKSDCGSILSKVPSDKNSTSNHESDYETDHSGVLYTPSADTQTADPSQENTEAQNIELSHKTTKWVSLSLTIFCQFCHLSFQSKTARMTHMYQCHTEKLLTCHACEKRRFFTRDALEKHQSTCRVYSCEKCLKSFSKTVDLRTHFISAHRQPGRKDITCNLCDRVYKSEELYVNHKCLMFVSRGQKKSSSVSPKSRCSNASESSNASTTGNDTKQTNRSPLKSAQNAKQTEMHGNLASISIIEQLDLFSQAFSPESEKDNFICATIRKSPRSKVLKIVDSSIPSGASSNIITGKVSNSQKQVMVDNSPSQEESDSPFEDGTALEPTPSNIDYSTPPEIVINPCLPVDTQISPSVQKTQYSPVDAQSPTRGSDKVSMSVNQQNNLTLNVEIPTSVTSKDTLSPNSIEPPSSKLPNDISNAAESVGKSPCITEGPPLSPQNTRPSPQAMPMNQKVHLDVNIPTGVPREDNRPPLIPQSTTLPSPQRTWPSPQAISPGRKRFSQIFRQHLSELSSDEPVDKSEQGSQGSAPSVKNVDKVDLQKQMEKVVPLVKNVDEADIQKRMDKVVSSNSNHGKKGGQIQLPQNDPETNPEPPFDVSMDTGEQTPLSPTRNISLPGGLTVTFTYGVSGQNEQSETANLLEGSSVIRDSQSEGLLRNPRSESEHSAQNDIHQSESSSQNHLSESGRLSHNKDNQSADVSHDRMDQSEGLSEQPCDQSKGDSAKEMSSELKKNSHGENSQTNDNSVKNAAQSESSKNTSSNYAQILKKIEKKNPTKSSASLKARPGKSGDPPGNVKITPSSTVRNPVPTGLFYKKRGRPSKLNVMCREHDIRDCCVYLGERVSPSTFKGENIIVNWKINSRMNETSQDEPNVEPNVEPISSQVGVNLGLNCAICDYEAWDKQALCAHVKKIHINNHIQCLRCGLYIEEKELASHVREKHPRMPMVKYWRHLESEVYHQEVEKCDGNSTGKADGVGQDRLNPDGQRREKSDGNSLGKADEGGQSRQKFICDLCQKCLGSITALGRHCLLKHWVTKSSKMGVMQGKSYDKSSKSYVRSSKSYDKSSKMDARGEKIQTKKSKMAATDLYCKSCDRHFHNKLALGIHMGKTHGIESKNINTPGATHRLLKDHQMHHQSLTKGNRLKCRKCNRHFPNRLALGIHLAKGHQHVRKCLRCSHTFTTKQLLERHITKTHFRTKKDLTCGLCDKVCSNRHHLALHVALSHRKKSSGKNSGLKSNQGKSDLEPSRDRSNAKPRKVPNGGNSNFESIGVQSKFEHSKGSGKIALTQKVGMMVNKGTLDGHVNRKSTEPSREFKTQTHSKSAAKIHSDTSSKDRNIDFNPKRKSLNLPPGGARELIKCTSCHMTFINQSALRMHQTVRHKMTVSEKIQLIKKRTCAVCSRIFGSVHAMNIHRTRIHGSGPKAQTRIYGNGPKGQTSNSSSPQSNSLNIRKSKFYGNQLESDGWQNFNISTIGNGSANVKDIYNAQEISNTSMKRSQNSSVKTVKSRKSVQNISNKGAKNHATKGIFSCSKCSRNYPTFQQLRSHQFHEWVSTQKARHNCRKCKRVFASQHWLNHHLKNVHPESMGKNTKIRNIHSESVGKIRDGHRFQGEAKVIPRMHIGKRKLGIKHPETMAKIIKERQKNHIGRKFVVSKKKIGRPVKPASKNTTTCEVNRKGSERRRTDLINRHAAIRLRNVKLIEKTKKTKPDKIIGNEKLW